MENLLTMPEKIDTLANYIEQMQTAHMIKDEKHFQKVYRKIADLLVIIEEEGEKMQDYERKVYEHDVDKIANDIKTLTDSQLSNLRDKFAEIKEFVDLYMIKNKVERHRSDK